MLAALKKRIEALQYLCDEGIATYLFVAPIFPAITPIEEIIGNLYSKIKYVCFENLNLRGSYYGRVMQFIQDNYLIYFSLYEQIYCQKNYDYWEKTSKLIDSICCSKN